MSDDPIDPFLDPVNEFRSVAEQDKDLGIPHDLPEGLKSVIEEILQHSGSSSTVGVSVLGPNGLQIVGQPGVQIPDEIIEALRGRLSMMDNPLNAKGMTTISAAMDRMRTAVDLDDPSTTGMDYMKALGFTSTEVDAISHLVVEMTMDVGRDNFTDDTFKRLYSETDMFESMVFVTEMFFALGVFVGREGLHGDDESDRGTEPGGDPGGDRAGEGGQPDRDGQPDQA